MTTKDYIKELTEDRRIPFQKLMTCISDNLPKGFQQDFIYKMPAFVVPKADISKWIPLYGLNYLCLL